MSDLVESRKRPASPLPEEEKQVEKKAKTTEEKVYLTKFMGDHGPWIWIRQEGEEWSLPVRQQPLESQSSFCKEAIDREKCELVLPAGTCTLAEILEVHSLFGDVRVGVLDRNITFIWTHSAVIDAAKVFGVMRLLDFLGMRYWLRRYEECVLECIREDRGEDDMELEPETLRLAYEYATARKKHDWIKAIASVVKDPTGLPSETVATLAPYWIQRSRTFATVESEVNDFFASYDGGDVKNVDHMSTGTSDYKAYELPVLQAIYSKLHPKVAAVHAVEEVD